MTFELHRASERGQAEHGWLHSRFSFSFADYHNPSRMGVGALRVLNDDTIEPSSGFGMHPHRDMEIITIVTKGCVEHRDDMGNHGMTRAWEVQRMSAGTGVMHSEFNPSQDVPLQLFQIWIYPRAKGITPSYEQQRFSAEQFEGAFVTMASGSRSDNALYLHQDAWIERGRFKDGQKVAVEAKAPLLYLYVIEGEITVADALLASRDAIACTQTELLELRCVSPSDLLLFHLPHRQ